MGRCIDGPWGVGELERWEDVKMENVEMGKSSDAILNYCLTDAMSNHY